MGKLDLFITGWQSSGLYHNNGNGAFTKMTNSFQWAQAGAVVWADVDNDGYPEIIESGDISGQNGGDITYIYHNNRNGTFSLLTSNLLNVYYSSLAVGDYDGDGFLDLLVAGDTARGVAPRRPAASFVTWAAPTLLIQAHLPTSPPSSLPLAIMIMTASSTLWWPAAIRPPPSIATMATALLPTCKLACQVWPSARLAPLVPGPTPTMTADSMSWLAACSSTIGPSPTSRLKPQRVCPPHPPQTNSC
jgi:hypothetical protein